MRRWMGYVTGKRHARIVGGTVAAWAMRVVALLAVALGVGGWNDARAQSCGGQWLPGQHVPGISGHVEAMAAWNPDGTGSQPTRLVVGGRLDGAGPVSARNIAMFDVQTSTWSPLGAGVDGTVTAVAFLGNGDLIAGGAFITAGGVSVNRIARWNGVTWSALGTGMNGSVKALAVLANGDVIAGGSFTEAGGVSVNRIARWNGTAWSAMGSGLNGTVFAVTILSGGDVIAGGAFTATGGVAANRIARWNGASWSAMGTGLNDTVWALTALPGGGMIAGGRFTVAGGVAANCVARWNGTAWSAMGTGMNGEVLAAATMAGGEIIAVGNFTTAGGVAANYVARWNGASWSSLGTGLNATAYAVTTLLGGALPGGAFSEAGGVQARGVATWDGTSWSAMATGAGLNESVTAMIVPPDARPIVSGFFTNAGGVPVNRVARWNGTSWSALGSGLSSAASAFTTLPNGDVIAGGFFTDVGGVPANRVARWNGASWSAMGSGMNNAVLALATLPNGDVIAGGMFTTADGVPANGVARWNGTAWIAMGSGVNGTAHALAVLPGGGVIAGGSFSSAGGAAANNIAAWNGSSWMPLGTGLNQEVFALLALANGDLIAGGAFTAAGGAPAKAVARWNGASWSALGQGIASRVQALTVLGNGDVVAGWEMWNVSDQAGAIARWDGTTWSSIGGGLSRLSSLPAVYALGSLPNGELFVGGSFTAAGDLPSGSIARFAAGVRPSTTDQPSSRTRCAGQMVTLTASPADGFANVSYRWMRNGVNIANGPGGASPGGGTVSGAAGTLASPTASSVATLAISSLEASDAGEYACVFTNPCGSSISVTTTLSVTGTGLVNDQIAGAMPLSIGVALSGDTSCATADAGVPECSGQAISAPGLWYRVAGTGNVLTVALCGSSFDTRLSAFCGSAGSLTCVAGNDDSCGAASSVSFCSQLGAEYFLLVHGYGGAMGAFSIVATDGGAPCTADVQCLPTGACCADGTCVQLSQPACVVRGGTFLGAGTTCPSISFQDLFASAGPYPIAITDFSTATDSIMVPPGSGTVASLAVRVGLEHTWVGDLTITLAKGGTAVTLVSQPPSGADLGGVYTFADLAEASFAQATSGATMVAPGVYRPVGSLSAFGGVPFEGRWAVTVSDGASGDMGRLTSFTLAAVIEPPACDACPSCVADFNVDGGVDAGDVNAFFESWEAGQPCADANADGGIDFADVDTFFASWEAGGC